MYSPCCKAETIKVRDSGEHVKACSSCGASWFLIKCKNGELTEEQKADKKAEDKDSGLRKLTKEEADKLKERVKAKLKESSNMKPADPSPRYDDVYWNGVEELDKE